MNSIGGKYLHVMKLLCLAVAMLVCFSACGGQSSSAAQPASSAPAVTDESTAEEPPVPGIDHGPIASVDYAENYEDEYSIIQIPQLVWEEGSRPVGDDVNREIMAFCQGYEEYLGGHAEEYSCEIVAYWTKIGGAWQIVIERAFYPVYGTYGATYTVLYDPIYDMVLAYEDIVAQYDLDAEAIDERIASGDYLLEPMELVSYEYTGFCLTDEGPIVLYDVANKAPEGEDWVNLFGIPAYDAPGPVLDKEELVAIWQTQYDMATE